MMSKTSRGKVFVGLFLTVCFLVSGIGAQGLELMQTYTFDADTNGWWFSGQIGNFTPPLSSLDSGALVLRAQNNIDSYGFWQNNPNDVDLESGKDYVVEFDVSTDEIERLYIPDLRLLAMSQDAQTVSGYATAFSVRRDSPLSKKLTAEPVTYTVMYSAPSQLDPTYNGLQLYFELLSFSSTDSPTASLFLHEVRVYRQIDTPSPSPTPTPSPMPTPYNTPVATVNAMFVGHTDVAITIDGDLSDWPGGLEVFPVNKYHSAYSDPTGPDDFEMSFRAFYDPQINKLFLGINVTDDNEYADNPSSAWFEDRIELYVDGNGNRTGGDPAEFQQYIFFRDGNAWVNEYDGDAPGFEYAHTNNGNDYVFEVSFTVYDIFPDFPLTLTEGHHIGLDFAWPDWDGSTGESSFVQWGPKENKWASSANFQYVRLGAVEDTP